MSRIEQAINARLERWPRLRTATRDGYQLLWSLVPAGTVRPVAPVRTRPGHFFGFHDLCPWSPDGRRLLAHGCGPLPVREPRPDDAVTVGWFPAAGDGPFVPLAATRAFNWQEGARLQWAGADIVFNVIDGRGRARARRVDVEGCALAEHREPVAAVAPDGRRAAGYDFGRPRRYDLAYSYAALQPDDRPAPADDGLRLTDLATDRRLATIPLRDLAAAEPDPTAAGAYHYVSHCEFAPDGRRLSFMHCWLAGGRRFSRLAVLDTATLALTVFRDFTWVSHHCWEGGDRIIAFAGRRGGGRRYHRLDADGGGWEPLDLALPAGDGHPQVAPGGRRLVTDTYPDRHRRQSLLVCDLDDGAARPLLSLRVPRRFRHGVRCDFHPRWNRAGDAVCFDAPHGRTRALCTLKLEAPADGAAVA